MRSRFQAHWTDAFGDCSAGRVLVAYSGGADSTALLHLLWALGTDVVAAHLDHQMRPESGDEAARCTGFCDSLGVPIMVGQADVDTMGSALGIGIEEAGRRARYAFLARASAETGCAWVATGHTIDDQAETVLFHLARGTGTTGAAGIHERHEGIIRPILAFGREETREYCRQNGLWFHDEPGNDDLARSRNQIRAHVVPALRDVNAKAREHIAQFASLSRSESEFMDGVAASVLERACLPTNGNLGFLTADCEADFDTKVLRHCHPAILARGLRLAVRFLGASLSQAQTDALASMVVDQVQGSVTTEGGSVVAVATPETLHVQLAEIAGPERYPLVVPGETISDYFGWQVVAAPTDPGQVRKERGSLSVVLDQDRLVGPIHLRGAKPGDTIQPLGMDGTKKVSDLFNEAGLTSAARLRLPIICDMAGIVWVPGLRMADRAQVGPGTNRALALSLEPLDGDRTS